MKKEYFLICPKLESRHLHILIFVISSLLRKVIPTLLDNADFAKLNSPEKYFKEKCYFDMLTNFIGDISVGVYILIKLIINKDKNKVTTSEGEKTKKNMSKIFFIYLPIIALIDFMAQLCLFLFSYIDKKGSILGMNKGQNTKVIYDQDLFFVVAIDIVCRYVFSRIFLKSYFYKHHYFSMIFNFIAFVPLIVINLKDIFTNENNKEIEYSLIIFYLILFIIMTILYSLEDVFNKIALNKLLLRPYELMFYKAVFEIIGIIIVSIIIMTSENFSNYINDNLSGIHLLGRLFYRLCFIVCNIFRTISLITIIEVLNPNHLSILKSTEFIALFIFIMIWSFLDNDKEKISPINIIFESFSFLFLLIGSLIHNEMIIINKWGLYECTDYYKLEVKGFSNIDVNFEENIKNDKAQDSLLGESLSQETD